MYAKTGGGMVGEGVDGRLQPGNPGSVEAKRSVGPEFGLDLFGAGGAGRAAEDVVDSAAPLAGIVAHHHYLGLEALRELRGLEGAPGHALGNLAYRCGRRPGGTRMTRL